MSVGVAESDSSDSDVFVVKQIKPINKLTIQQALIIKHGVLKSTHIKNNKSHNNKKKTQKTPNLAVNKELKPKKKKVTETLKDLKKNEETETEQKSNLYSKKHSIFSNDTTCLKITNESKLIDNKYEEQNSDNLSSQKLFSKKNFSEKEKKINLKDVHVSFGNFKKRKIFENKGLELDEVKNLSVKTYKKAENDITDTSIFMKQNLSHSFVNNKSSLKNENESNDISQEEKFPAADFLNIIGSYENLTEEKCKDNSELLCFLFKKIIRDETKKQMELETKLYKNYVIPEKLISKKECEIFEKFFNINESACKLYVRMLCRKRNWHRVSAITYKDISNNLITEFKLLEKENFIDVNIEEEDLETQMKLLNKAEVLQLCKAFNLSAKSYNLIKKESLINKLVDEIKKQRSVAEIVSSKNKESRVDLLKAEIIKFLGMCVKLNETALSAFYKILILFSFPHYYLEEEKRFSNQLYMGINVFRDVIKFPKYKLSSTIVFKTLCDFEKYVEALKLLDVFEIAVTFKNLHRLSDVCIKAKKEFIELLNNNDFKKRFLLMEPFLQKFNAGSVYAKILTGCCESFIKKIYVTEVIDILKILLDQNLFLKRKRGQWYIQLFQAFENLKESNLAAELIIRSIEDSSVDKVQRMTLQLKGLTLLKKKNCCVSGLNLREKLSELCSIFVPEPPSIEIKGKTLPKSRPGHKCVYLEEKNGEMVLTSVEERAISYYKSQGFEKGYHVEGYFVQTIYFLLFFDIIYGTSPPGVFQSLYQQAPLDFYSEYFYINRKDAIDSLLNEMIAWTDEEVEKKLKAVYYENFNVSCVISWKEHFTPDLFCGIIKCITMPVIALICQKFVQNFRIARAGFPDLTLLNLSTGKCKFVEVKSPNDKLSPAQRIWLEYLRNIGLDCEVCNVRNVSSKEVPKI